MNNPLSPRIAAPRRFLPNPEAVRAHAAMLLFSALVSGSFTLGALSAQLISPLALNAMRFAIAAALLAAVVLVSGQLRREHLAAPWRYAILGGLLAIFLVSMFEGLKTAPPVSAAAVFTLTPVMAAGFGWLVMRQVTTLRMALALGLAAAGAIWVIFDADIAALLGFRIGRGETIFFFGCIAHALYAPMVPRLRRSEPATVITLGLLVAGLAFLLLFGARDVVATDWTGLPVIVWVTIAYLAVFASSVTFFLLQYAVLRLPSAKVMAYSYLIPVWVILIEGAIGHGWPPAEVLAGVALVVMGLLLLLKD